MSLGIKGLRAQKEPSLVYPQCIKGTIFSLSALDHAQSYYTRTSFPVELIHLGIYNLRSELGRYLAVHWLRTDPSGLVRPLSLCSSLPTPQTSTHTSGLPGCSSVGSSMDDAIPRDSGVQTMNY